MKYLYIITNILAISLISCSTDNYNNFIYSYCDNNGVYGELFFYEDSLAVYYSTFNCDSNNIPINLFFIVDVKLPDTLVFRNSETHEKLFSAKYGKVHNTDFFIEFFDGQTYDTLKAVQNSSYYQPFKLSDDSLEIWNREVYYQEFKDRFKVKNCTCGSIRNEREIEIDILQ